MNPPIHLGDIEPHKVLYEQLKVLDLDNKNGIWARIIKNAFAPLFIDKVDFVAGNPPWVNWENLPDEYRKSMIPLWQEYGLFSLSGSEGRLGGGKKDLSMIFVYSAIDNYLTEGKRLGFVITQSVFKTKGAGDGFRQLQFRKNNNLTYYLKPISVLDLSQIQVFEGATNQTAVFICEKSNQAFHYPIHYLSWHGPSRINQDVSIVDVKAIVSEIQMEAIPVNPNQLSSPWLTAPGRALSGIRKVIGKSVYQAHLGVNTGGLNGCFWVNIIEKRPNGELIIENLHDVGKIKVKRVEAVIESDLVYPLLRGRDVNRWHAEPSTYIILSQDPKTRQGIPEVVMKQQYPKTYAFLKNFEGDPKKPQRGSLRGRSIYLRYFKPTDPFYSMYNVGSYTIQPIRIFWRQFIPELRMTLCLPVEDKYLGKKIPLTQHVVTLIPFSTEEEAYYFSALGNSSPATMLHTVSSTGKSYGQPSILENIRIEQFNPKDGLNIELAELSKQCHILKAEGKDEDIILLETEIDKKTAQIWGITDDELKAIQETMEEMSS